MLAGYFDLKLSFFVSAPVLCALATALLCFNFPCGAEDSADSLYDKQLKKPGEKINTGVAYWLELHRGGNKSQVSNRTAFRSGDGLRFHCQPNFNGYAYILMMEASQGDHYVLFPTKNFPNNKFAAGKEISLPVGNEGSRAWLKFDKIPGTETLRLILSRKPIDTGKQFGKTDGVTIAVKKDEDKIPDGTLVSEEPVVDDSERRDDSQADRKESKRKPLEGRVTVVERDPAKLLMVDVVLNHVR